MKLLLENWRDYIREPDEERKCLTPDAMFDMDIRPDVIGVKVRLPMEIDISEEEAKELEDQMHDAMETILAKYFEDN